MLSRYSRILGLISIILFSVSFSKYENSQNLKYDLNTPPFIQDNSQWVDSVFNSLSLEAKIAQLFMVAAYSNKSEKHVNEISHIIEKYRIGGLVFFQGGPVRQAKLTNLYQEKSKIPLLIAQDCEWGLGMRLDSVISFPYQMMLGAIQDDQLIYKMGKEIASQLIRMGIHSSFSPVLDVNNNPNNPVINHRSFGENKYKVSAKSYAYMSGLQDENIMAFGKHFPGHGDTDSDSHYNLPVIKHNAEHLYETELYPFRHLVNMGISGIMAAHLAIPALDSTNTPASLSSGIINVILKEQMGFKGLVITDALNMKGVQSDNLKPGELEVKALAAGNDILLMSEDVPRAIKIIKRAIRKGNLSIDDIENSCKKVLNAKYWVGLADYKPVKLDHLYEDLNNNDAKVLNQRLIEASLTLVKNKNSLLPLQRLDTLKIAGVLIGKESNSEFNNYLSKYSNVDKYILDKDEEKGAFSKLYNSLSGYNLVIIGVSKTSQKSKLNFGITDATIDFVEKMANEKKVVLSLFANPYSLALFNDLENISSVIVAYNDYDQIQKSVAQMIFGGLPILGKLPVSVSNNIKEGKGEISFRTTRIRYSFPEYVGLSSEKLSLVDSFAIDAINSGATPGCQILIARKGVVVYEKAFGYHTYDKSKEVLISDLYDLASITKVAASLPSIMELFDDNEIDLNKTFGDYISVLDTTNKKDIVLQQALCHQGRLKAWIPFYINTLDEGKLKSELFMNKPMPGYTTEVVKGLFILDSYRDSIYTSIYSSDLREKEEYKYSDLGYYLFQLIIEDLTGQSIEEYVKSHFYDKLGVSRLGYLPLQKFSLDEIVPTENDVDFRQTLVHGYVHDPGAAMLGGVAGHAGLFSNAGDLAKLMQMYLWKGKYGDYRFFKEGTIDLFSSAPYLDNENRRGIGFDKPEMDYSKDGPTFQGISGKSFGHSGFTGTLAWVDPDKEIVYVFLSNRIYPEASNTKLIKMNVRTNIQEAIYKAIQ